MFCDESATVPTSITDEWSGLIGMAQQAEVYWHIGGPILGGLTLLWGILMIRGKNSGDSGVEFKPNNSEERQNLLEKMPGTN